MNLVDHHGVDDDYVYGSHDDADWKEIESNVFAEVDDGRGKIEIKLSMERSNNEILKTNSAIPITWFWPLHITIRIPTPMSTVTPLTR